MKDLRPLLTELLRIALPVTMSTPLDEKDRDVLELAKLAASSPLGPRIAIDATEEEILTYLHAKAATYNVPGLLLTIAEQAGFSSQPNYLQVLTICPAISVGFGYAKTIDEAVANLVAKIETRETKAARLRAEANKLLEEARAMSGIESVLP